MQVATGDPAVVFKTQLADPFGPGIDLVFVLGADGVLTYAITNDCEDGSAAVLTGHATP